MILKGGNECFFIEPKSGLVTSMRFSPEPSKNTHAPLYFVHVLLPSETE